jgi:hypothetical protein
MEEILFNSQQGQMIFLLSKAFSSAMGFLSPSISLSRLGMGGCMPPVSSDVILACRGTGLDFSMICHLWNFLHIMKLS